MSVGTMVLALDPKGAVCGATVVATEGQYGLLACYGDDPTTSEDEGARPGDTIQLVVDGEVLATGTWTAHGDRQWRPLGKGYPVGGVIVPVNRLELLAPWMGLVILAGLAALGVTLARRRRG